MTSLDRFELHRTGIGLVPPPGEEGGAVWIESPPDASKPLRLCTCRASKKKTCPHLLELSQGIEEVRRSLGGNTWERVFARSLWGRLAALLAEEDPRPCEGLRLRRIERQGESAVSLTDARGRELVRYHDPSPSRLRLLERLGAFPGKGPTRDRKAVLERLARLQLTAAERQLEKAGMKTRKQAREESLWARLAYHALREHGDDLRFHPAVDRRHGTFTLSCDRGSGEPILRFAVPPPAVAGVLELLRQAFPDQEDLEIHPLPLRTLFRVTEATEVEGDELEVRPVLQTLQAGGEAAYLERPDFEKFRYGRLVFVPELGVLAELERQGSERRFTAPRRLRLSRSQVGAFLGEHRDEVAAGGVAFDGALAGYRIFDTVERVEIAPGEDGVDLDEAAARSWYWLSVRYAFGAARVSLAELLAAREEGLAYLEVVGGWVDLEAPAVRAATEVFGGRPRPPADDDGRLRLGAVDLLRLGRAVPAPVAVTGEGVRAELVERLLTLRPARPLAPCRGLASSLRPYQVLGVEWLRFLAENRLSGLLCDEMGLGKTHQAMALMASLREQDGVTAPFLVVSPTTVVPHWQAKIREHAPGLRAVAHCGPGRDLAASLDAGDVLLTSYGVLRNDAAGLAEVEWGLVVFDEIQHLKNSATATHRAAAQISAAVRLGLTGTPIENALADLKALFDLLLPGYLGSDDAFARRYGQPGEVPGADELAELHRLTSPFVLRRTKGAVLAELPEKFEDLRLCALSEEQVALYRQLVGDRGEELRGKLRATEEPIPYVHVFALLNRLKQVCDHPALALGRLEHADRMASGKWDLFCELLDEALDAGQKVVVFSQYLGMITLMERLLVERGVGYAVLTGASRRRGELVDRFNRDPACRVFLGSLKAGGTGIDLVGGSVVVHYDRWWNAAREDQATDRVHRMGQKNAVQVLKLVTEGTLEEKIHAVIERKRRLAAAVVPEDSPRLAKLFSREELLSLLEPV